MTSPAAVERVHLCDLFDEVGPDAPTLCGDWTTRDLAAHLIVRENRPDGAVGILFKPFGEYAEKVRRDEAKNPWGDLVERVRQGPPWWSPTRIDAVDQLVNSVEFFVHHEDVRRAEPGWTVRELPDELIEALGTGLRRAGMLLRKIDHGVRLVPTDGPRAGESLEVRHGEPVVTVTGRTGELVLFSYGREPIDVEFDGDPAAVAAVLAGPRGF